MTKRKIRKTIRKKKKMRTKKNLEIEAVSFIAKHEGFAHYPYNDLGGGKSIGYGQPAETMTWVDETYARNYVYDVVEQIQKNYAEYFVGLTFNEKIVLIDVIYNCHPNNISYIVKQMRIEDKELERQETTYALSTLQYAKGVKYGGLVKRYNARIAILFN
jgi:GH24 family phage-related lysozyme (muramidase)